MGTPIEKIYYLENPEAGIKRYVTETQLRYEDIIKDVFGVAFINDLSMMIQYNKRFQECVCNANKIKENEITLDLVFRVASKKDLIPLKNDYIKKIEEAIKNNETIDPPFNTTIQLHEGIYKWNDKEYSYNKVT